MFLSSTYGTAHYKLSFQVSLSSVTENPYCKAYTAATACNWTFEIWTRQCCGRGALKGLMSASPTPMRRHCVMWAESGPSGSYWPAWNGSMALTCLTGAGNGVDMGMVNGRREWKSCKPKRKRKMNYMRCVYKWAKMLDAACLIAGYNSCLRIGGSGSGNPGWVAVKVSVNCEGVCGI